MCSSGLTATNSAGNDIELSAGPAQFSCRLLANPAQLRPARHAIAFWATGIGLTPDRVEDLALAVGEALSNSIEHAYPTDAGRIEIDGRVIGSQLQVVVSDHGCWRNPGSGPGWRGRGISMIHALTHDARVEHQRSGTTVTMVWNLRG
jgi:anti-sigma regulatory factor (Ser/Thr protein kinase)